MNLVNIEYKLGQIDGKLDMLLEFHRSSGAQNGQRDKRIGALEKFQWKTAGALSAWAVVLSLVLAWWTHAKR